MSEASAKEFYLMNVAAIMKEMKERGITVSGYVKPLLVEIGSAGEKMAVPADLNFKRDDKESNMKR